MVVVVHSRRHPGHPCGIDGVLPPVGQSSSKGYIRYTLTPCEIVKWLTPFTKRMQAVKAGFCIPVAILFALSFPPLFGNGESPFLPHLLSILIPRRDRPGTGWCRLGSWKGFRHRGCRNHPGRGGQLRVSTPLLPAKHTLIGTQPVQVLVSGPGKAYDEEESQLCLPKSSA